MSFLKFFFRTNDKKQYVLEEVEDRLEDRDGIMYAVGFEEDDDEEDE